MTLTHTLALGLLALGLVTAHTIPDITPELEKKLAEVVAEAIKDEKPIENITSEQELIDQANTIKDVENKLRMKPTEIPVKVVQEESKLVLKNSNSKEETSDVGVKHAEPDLEHPGAPQHQEHNAQNAVHYEDSQILLTDIKKVIADSQVAFNQGYAVVSEHVRNFFIKDEQIAPIQNSIRELQNSFTTQIEKLNKFVRNSFTPQGESSMVAPEKETQLKSGLETIESQLKQVESKFQKGLNTISNGVEVFAKVKAESSDEPAKPAEEAAPAPAPAAPAPAPAPPTNPLGEFISMWQTNVQAGLTNVQNSLSNLFSGQTQNQGTASQPAQSGNEPTLSEGSTESTVAGQGNPFQGPLQIFQNIFNPASNNAAPAGAQADVSATQRPNLFQQVQQGLQGGIQNLQNIFTPNQQQTAQQQAAQSDVQQPAANQPSRPFDLSNIPVIGNVVQFLQPRPPPAQPIKPADPVKNEPANAESTPTGTNMVPEKMESNSAPAAMQEEKPDVPQKGPIQQISQQIQKNPIMKGIQGAVQRFQHTISRSPDEPREVITEKAGKTEATLTSKSDMSAGKGHGGSGGANNGDSNDSDGSGIVKEKQKMDTKKPESDEKKEQKIDEAQKPAEPQMSDMMSNLPDKKISMEGKL